MYVLYVGDVDKIKNKFFYIKYVVVKCYIGDYVLCKKYLLVCKGRVNNNWVCKSFYLG